MLYTSRYHDVYIYIYIYIHIYIYIYTHTWYPAQFCTSQTSRLSPCRACIGLALNFISQGTIACFNVPNDIFQGTLVYPKVPGKFQKWLFLICRSLGTRAEDLGAEHRGRHLILYMSIYHCIYKCLNVNDAVSCLNYQGIFHNIPGYTYLSIYHN